MTDTKSKAAGAQPNSQAKPLTGINPKLIDNVTVGLEAYLGEAKMTVAELSALQQGATVALEAPLSQSIELRLNGVPVARGELVAAGDKFAVRLTEISK